MKSASEPTGARNGCRAPGFARLAWLAVCLLPCLFVAAGHSTLAAEADTSGKLVMQTVKSKALGKNTLGEPGHRNVMVYLPPSYDQSERRYPVVYLLHGYDETNTVWRDGRFLGFILPDSMDELIRNGAVRDMILVMPDARNFYFGSFYANSAVTGGWEDFIAGDLPAYIDSHYRTIATRDGRGIAGHSMGGYGALYIAARNPEVFSAVWGISSATLAMVGDVALEEEWKKTLELTDLDQLAGAGNFARAYVAIAAALSPNPGRPPFQADFPFRMKAGQLERNPDVYARWTRQFPADAMDDFEKGFRALDAIAFDFGNRDPFTHIPAGSRLLSERLAERGIAHRFETYDGGHWDGVGRRLREHVLPYFSRELESRSLLAEMFSWWNGIINSDEPLTADQFRRYFTEDGVILVNNREQVRGVEHMPEHFQAIRERPGTIEIELPFIEEFQSGNRIFTYHRIISRQESGEQVTHNMGYAILEGNRIARISLARFQEESQP